jgi:hypothetical protein
MTRALALLLVAPMALAACQGTQAPAPSGGSAGAMGEAYCETRPSDPAEVTNWENLCMPDQR